MDMFHKRMHTHILSELALTAGRGTHTHTRITTYHPNVLHTHTQNTHLGCVTHSSRVVFLRFSIILVSATRTHAHIRAQTLTYSYVHNNSARVECVCVSARIQRPSFVWVALCVNRTRIPMIHKRTHTHTHIHARNTHAPAVRLKAFAVQ